MSSNSLVPRSSCSLVQRGSREIRAIERQVAVALVHEDGEADVVDGRIRNGVALALRAGERLTALNRSNTELSQGSDNVELQMNLRLLEREVTLEVGSLISTYLRR